VRAFVYERAADPATAVRALSLASGNQPVTHYLAGGTTLLDLMKLDVMRPQTVIDINDIERTASGRIEIGKSGLQLGALVRMAEAADHHDINEQYPVIAQSLKLAASPQIRNMASLGGNVLQRTRCTYFRDPSYAACNKRNPGSGCAAMDGYNRSHAVLGVSGDCIATYAGDFAQALIALDATVMVASNDGTRAIPFAALHRAPADRPDLETTLRPGELIVRFVVPAAPFTRRSLYLKVRDRQSYEFALASAAVALDIDNDTVREARIALGGLATIPWRASDAEASLRHKPINAETVAQAAEAAFAGAQGHGHNDFKIELGKRTLQRALREAAALEV
jgi:xanthine dehydrogenase YagS FAD-binding subunit